MKKIAAAFIVAGLGLFAMVPAAFAKSAETQFDLPNGTHVKTDICHNVDHNPVVVHVNINSAKFPYATGHGDLVLDGSIGFVSFTPHVGTGGHAHDFVLRVYTKHGNIETNTYVSERECAAEVTTTTTEPPTTTTTQPPVTTTTTVPDVTTTTQPPVTTTTNPTNVVCPDGTELGLGVPESSCPAVTTTTEAPAVTTTTEPSAVVTAAPAATTLAHTGSWSFVMAMIGAALGLLGIGLMLMASATKRAEN